MAASLLAPAMASLALGPASVTFSEGGTRSAAAGGRFASFCGLACNGLAGGRAAAGRRQATEETQRVAVVQAVSAPRKEKRKVRHERIRRKLSGTAERPRLAVFRSNKHIYAQVIDDTQMHTLAAASTIQPSLREELKLTAGPTIEAARRVGVEIAKVAVEKGITKVAFDRGGFLYHGRIQALAEGAREGGLEF